MGRLRAGAGQLAQLNPGIDSVEQPRGGNPDRLAGRHLHRVREQHGLGHPRVVRDGHPVCGKGHALLPAGQSAEILPLAHLQAVRGQQDGQLQAVCPVRARRAGIVQQQAQSGGAVGGKPPLCPVRQAVRRGRGGGSAACGFAPGVAGHRDCPGGGLRILRINQNDRAGRKSCRQRDRQHRCDCLLQVFHVHGAPFIPACAGCRRPPWQACRNAHCRDVRRARAPRRMSRYGPPAGRAGLPRGLR